MHKVSDGESGKSIAEEEIRWKCGDGKGKQLIERNNSIKRSICGWSIRWEDEKRLGWIYFRAKHEKEIRTAV